MSGAEVKPVFSVLIIDDEVAIRELLEFDLKDKGYLTYTASSLSKTG
jgi:CheY-like chemotaxis protein